MTDHDNLTTSDLAEPRHTGDETAEDMPLTRQDEFEADRLDSQAPEPAGPGPGGPVAGGDVRDPLLPSEQSEQFDQRWHEIQTSFVDEPRQAVEQADSLVAELMQELASGFSQTRSTLEAQWDNEGDDASTEDLRVALTRYRSFFNRLLSA